MIEEYPDVELAAQPIGAGSGEAYRRRASGRATRGSTSGRTRGDPADFVTTVNVLRRMVASLGGDGNLPD
ncbi:hypothetical protein L1857_31390 [Amycolatopsis thermalba]|uniref:Uncharacterized protein n=1 Tax=Amycolatopsis thermalba TaxID=944492 RepID=A0ABY4P3X1_9PSEU|nr:MULTISPECIES: hypothetical protein [Amycolatopsis]UQS26984.1 hypothetical protein L1857_31390 [Amycolatopsis thermalba]